MGFLAAIVGIVPGAGIGWLVGDAGWNEAGDIPGMIIGGILGAVVIGNYVKAKVAGGG